jgi:hypothetical protein
MYDPIQMISKETTDPFWDYVNEHKINIGKPNQRTELWDDINKIERGMTDEEFYNFVRTSGTEIKRRIMEDMMPKELSDDEIKKESDKIKTEVRQNTKTEMFGWGDFRMANPEQWKILKDNNAIQTQPKTIEDTPISDTEMYKFTEEDVVVINNRAMELYTKEMIKYINSTEGKNAKTKVIMTPKGTIMEFDFAVDKIWTGARSQAKGEQLEKVTKVK